MRQSFCATAARYLAVILGSVELDRIVDLQTLQLPVAMLMTLCVIGLLLPNHRERSA